MSSEKKQEILNNFISITQCSSEEALRYLEAAQWNVDTAMEIFFDNGGDSSNSEPSSTANRNPVATNVNPPSYGKPGSNERDADESDEETPFQAAIAESLRDHAATASSKDNKNQKPGTSSKFGTIGAFNRDESESDEEGQTFYAGGSEHSGQQIVGPSKGKGNKKVERIFDAARKQGATEADDNGQGSSQKQKEKSFTGVGYTLGDNNTPSRSTGLSSVHPKESATNQPEQIPIRFYANGFTVGDGELRKMEENKEFMDYIKRGEVPPELRNLTSSGRQIEVRLEDHRNEDYKPIAPQFKPFGGAGHMLGSPTPYVTHSATGGQAPIKSSIVSSNNNSGATTTSVNDNLSNLEKIAEEQLKSSTSTALRLRLPDISTPVRIPIGVDRTLADLRKFLNTNVASLRTIEYDFIEPPSTKIKREDETKTIANSKLTNATLAIRRAT